MIKTSNEQFQIEKKLQKLKNAITKKIKIEAEQDFISAMSKIDTDPWEACSLFKNAYCGNIKSEIGKALHTLIEEKKNEFCSDDTLFSVLWVNHLKLGDIAIASDKFVFISKYSIVNSADKIADTLEKVYLTKQVSVENLKNLHREALFWTILSKRSEERACDAEERVWEKMVVYSGKIIKRSCKCQIKH